MLFYLITFALYSMSLCNNIAHDLTTRFNDVSIKKCSDSKNNKLPLYACSGLTMRGFRIDEGNRKPAWSLNPINIKLGSVSAAFTRNDTKIESSYPSGFILFPPLHTKWGHPFEVYCAFPLDGVTYHRKNNHGCTTSSDEFDITGTSNFCDDMRIFTIDDWIKHYDSIHAISEHFLPSQCAFNMQKDTAHTAFDVLLQAHAHAQKNPDYALVQNELLIKAWNPKQPKTIPIEAFYHLHDSSKGLGEARYHQEQYLLLTGITVPIVSIHFPTPANPNIVIKYVLP